MTLDEKVILEIITFLKLYIHKNANFFVVV